MKTERVLLGLPILALFFLPALVVAQATPSSSSSVTEAVDSWAVQSSINQIVEQALPVIRKGGAKWIADNDCLSCHRTSVHVWSLNRAFESEFESDVLELEGWNTWATTWLNLVKPTRREGAEMKTALRTQSDTVAQLLMGRPVETDQETPAWVSAYRQHLLEAQNADGSWEPSGQLPLQKRPKRETKEVTTMWVLLGLAAGGTSAKRLESASAKARKWLGTETSGESTEWWAARLLLERSQGNADPAAALRKHLISLQHDDGGWGWIAKEESDALGTGYAIYALARDGVSPDHPSIQKAIQFLANNQQEDGSWQVNGTKASHRKKVTETASYWGACWAVIGLLEFDRSAN